MANLNTMLKARIAALNANRKSLEFAEVSYMFLFHRTKESNRLTNGDFEMTYDEILAKQTELINEHVIEPLIDDQKDRKRIEDLHHNPEFHNYYHYFRDRGVSHDIAETRAEEMCK